MNVSQIVRLASFNADAIKTAGTLSPFVTTAELLAWANEGSRKLEHKLRTLNVNYFERIMQSTSTAAEKIMGIDYTPAVSLPIAANTNTLTLPPDFQSLTFIKIITSGQESVILEKLSHNHHDFLTALRDTTARSPGTSMLFDIIGERTFMWVPRLSSALDIELGYIARPKRLHTYTTGTAACGDGVRSVVGTGTRWLAGAPFDSAYLDVMFSTSTTAVTADPSLVYDGTTLSRVASIESDTGLTLASTKTGAVSGVAYALASIPAYPEDYHYLLSDYVTMKVLAKAGDPAMARAVTGWPDNIADMLTTARDRQTEDPEVIEDWEPNA